MAQGEWLIEVQVKKVWFKVMATKTSKRTGVTKTKEELRFNYLKKIILTAKPGVLCFESRKYQIVQLRRGGYTSWSMSFIPYIKERNKAGILLEEEKTFKIKNGEEVFNWKKGATWTDEEFYDWLWRKIGKEQAQNTINDVEMAEAA